MMKPLAPAGNPVDQIAFATLQALESPNAIFALYLFFSIIITGSFIAGVFQNVF
jgi:hypothetical protein